MNYQDFFQKAKEKGITNIQISEKHTIDSTAEIINGKLSSYDDYNNIDYNIKGEYNNKTVKAKTNYLDEDVLDLIILKSETTDSKYKDEYLNKKNNIEKKEPVTFDISNEIKRLKDLEKIRGNEISKLRSFFSETYTNTRIVNSNGVDISTDSHLCSFSAEAVYEKNGKSTSYDRQIITTNKEEILFEDFTKDIIEKACLQSKKEKLETKKYNIILDSYAASNILNHLVAMISAYNVRNRITCLEKMINKKIFNNKITIIEDPKNNKYPGVRLFDDEGCETQKKTIVEKGVLKTFLYNIKEAKLKRKKSTGNGYQDITTRNLYLVPGKKSLEELMKDLKDGIYITDYMGASGTSINTVNGQISLQIFGFLIKDGKIVSGIEPSIMTTTIFELLTNVKEIGNDLQFTNLHAASPSLYIKDISIAR